MKFSLFCFFKLILINTEFYYIYQVAMTREKFPEKIPFRLTRMLTNAMEVSVETEGGGSFILHVKPVTVHLLTSSWF